jgi:hypothetical protein
MWVKLKLLKPCANSSQSVIQQTGSCRAGVVKQLDSVEFYEMNWLSESLSMNVFQMRGIAFIPDNVKPDTDRESDAKTYSCGETV